jgi:hypothetical protein
MQIDDEAGSSPEVEVEASAPEAQAETSTKSAGETEDSLLAVVRAVAEKSDAPEMAEASESPTEGQESTVDQAADARKDDDFSDIPFNKHPRFRELVKEKNTYKAKIAEYEPDAQQYREIQSFMQRTNLSPQEVAEGLMLMAEMKSGDPAKAHDVLMKKAESLALAAGKKLPQELEEKVDQGYIDRDTAQQLYQQQTQAQRQAAIAQQQLMQRHHMDVIGSQQAMANAVATWEQSTRATDPDYDLKADLVKDRIRAHMAVHGAPRSAEHALSLSRQAYEDVTQTLQRAKGSKPAMRPAVGGKVSGSVAPEPRNLLDVIRRASAGV